MKKVLTGLLATLSLAAFAQSAPVHLDLEMTSVEYRGLLKQMNQKETDDPAIALALKQGERLQQWLADENARRTPETALRLTSAGTRRGIPIDAPSIYSEKTIQATHEKLAKELPADMLAVLNGAAFPTQLPADDAEFVRLARLVDRNYQSAARFKSLKPYMSYYVRAKAKDVRSYYFFRKDGWTSSRFADFSGLPETQKAAVRENLAGMCLNDGFSSFNSCTKKVAKAEAAGTLGGLYATLSATSVRVWNEFFDIPADAVRSDVDHTDPNVMKVPFNTPSIAKFIPYLQDNVEDEFRFGTWGLKVVYGTYPDGPLLKFEPGVVPHVNGLGGNEIVMDSNQPIEEYESQWTIRHEFGHVIGLPDCYHEFYDSQLGAFVNYQLDIQDLMCSRAGNMNERLAVELQRVYKK
jgi:hypothetical protein